MSAPTPCPGDGASHSDGALMRIAIVGATGRIARHAVVRAVGNGHEVVALSANGSG